MDDIVKGVTQQQRSPVKINFISWRAKRGYCGTEYRQELLLDGLGRYAQLQRKRQRLVQILSIVQDQKFFRARLTLDCPMASAEEIEHDAGELMTMLRRFIRYP